MVTMTTIVEAEEEQGVCVVKPSVDEMKYISFEKSVCADDALPSRGEEDVDQLCNLIDSNTAEGNYPSARSHHTTFHIIRP